MSTQYASTRADQPRAPYQPHSSTRLPRARRLVDNAPSALAPFAGHKPASDLADRLITGCVYQTSTAASVAVLVTRAEPKRIAKRWHAWWPHLAPSVALLHLGAEQSGGRDGFAQAYRAELEALPLYHWYGAILDITKWLRTSSTVMLLSFERVPTHPEHRQVTQRNVLRTWLLAPLNDRDSQTGVMWARYQPHAGEERIK